MAALGSCLRDTCAPARRSLFRSCDRDTCAPAHRLNNVIETRYNKDVCELALIAQGLLELLALALRLRLQTL